VYNWRVFPWLSNDFTLKDIGIELKDGEKASMINLWDKTQAMSDITSSTQKIKVGMLHSHGSFTCKITVVKADEELEIIQ